MAIEVMVGLSAAHAEVLASGWVPNSFLPQGQVQLVSEENRMSVRVLLHTRFLDRVVHGIANKEKANWQGDHDAVTYIHLLQLARSDVKAATGGRGKETMMISFVIQEGGGNVEWATGKVTEENGTLVMDEARILRTFSPSPGYLLTNAVLILEDSLGMSRDKAHELLAAHISNNDLPP